MITRIILYIIVLCAESSNGLLVYKNDCGTLTVSEPAIDSKRVLLTFIPHGTVNQETEVEWKLHATWTINNSSKYILSSQQYIYTMDLYYEKSDKGPYSAKLITPAEECSSGWVSLDIRNGVFNVTAKDTVLQAPTGCGILYKGPKRIKPGDEVVLKYHRTQRDEYIRQLRVKTDDCAEQFGCPVNEAWYEEESTEYSSMYLYKFRNFSSEMEGNYLIQCTNRSSHNNATNDVKLIIPVPPSSPTFLNTVDVGNCTSCLLVRSGKTAIQCQVIGGTPPVTVKIVIDGKDEVLCDLDQPFNNTYNATIYLNSSLHLKDIRCEAKNEALDQPLTTSTKLYVVPPTGCGILYKGPERIRPGGEVVLKYHQTKGDENNRQLRVKTDDCAGQFGCPVNEAWYEEESAEYNSMYLYKFKNFSSKMEGNYLIQCTNRSSHNNATNDVKLIIPVPPSSPTFLNTVDVENCTSCLLVRSGKTDIQCQVIEGTPPVTVKIVIDGKDEVLCDLDQPFNKTYNATIYVNSGLHLKDIRCEAENEALDQPLTTSTKLYVLQYPVGPELYSPQQTEGKVNISCKSWFGRPAPHLSLLIDGNLINTTVVPTKDPDKHIKLTYLKKDWNGAKIECCMTHLCYEKPKCSAENIDYLFSPASVILTSSKPEPSGIGGFRQKLQCTTVNANPACGVKWNHPNGAEVTFKNITRPTGQGGYTTVSELLLNGKMEMDGSEIDCRPNCDKFKTKDIATYTIRIPSADKTISESREKTLPWEYIGIGAAAGVVVLVIVTVLVIKKRINTERCKTAHEDIPMNGQAIVNGPRLEQNGADDSINEATYVNTGDIAGRCSLKAEANIFKPVPSPDKQPADPRDTEHNAVAQPGPSNLVYAELNLPTEGATSINPKTASAERQTEYVSIDFNKVGEQLPEPLDTEPKYIYSNQ